MTMCDIEFHCSNRRPLDLPLGCVYVSNLGCDDATPPLSNRCWRASLPPRMPVPALSPS
jgi:hypothetical protein